MQVYSPLPVRALWDQLLVGCAFLSESGTRAFSLPSNASVFTSELVAIAKFYALSNFAVRIYTSFIGFTEQPFCVDNVLPF